MTAVFAITHWLIYFVMFWQVALVPVRSELGTLLHEWNKCLQNRHFQFFSTQPFQHGAGSKKSMFCKYPYAFAYSYHSFINALIGSFSKHVVSTHNAYGSALVAMENARMTQVEPLCRAVGEKSPAPQGIRGRGT